METIGTTFEAIQAYLEAVGIFEAVLLGLAGALGLAAVLAAAGFALWRDPWVLLWPLRPKPRNVLAWLAALAIAAGYVANAWSYQGHTTCDFACQWLMGRMFARGDAEHLYVVRVQKEAFKDGSWITEETLAATPPASTVHDPTKGFPRDLGERVEDGKRIRTIHLNEKSWVEEERGPDGAVLRVRKFTDMREDMIRDILLKGSHSHEREIEGPLYPPTHGLLMWPAALLEPWWAHRVLAAVYGVMGFLAGGLIAWGTRGRLKTGEAALLCYLFPNYAIALVLGQNSALTLLIVVAGWALWARGWPVWGGIVWGLLVYKPVFAVALVWVPLVLLYWRVVVGMVLSGAAFCLLTLPFCGFNVLDKDNPWQRWLVVGQHAADIYAKDANWIWMSRDLLGLPRRAMWDEKSFNAHVKFFFRTGEWSQEELNDWYAKTSQGVDTSEEATRIGQTLMACVIGLTVLIAWVAMFSRWANGYSLCFDPAESGTAFGLYGGLLTCYHFMHYDLLPMALPSALLVANAWRLGWLGRGWLLLLSLMLLVANADLGFRHGSIRIPFETYILLLAWVTAGVLTFWHTALALPVRISAGVGGRGLRPGELTHHS